MLRLVLLSDLLEESQLVEGTGKALRSKSHMVVDSFGPVPDTMYSDPYLAGVMGAAAVEGLQQHVIAVTKHFIGLRSQCFHHIQFTDYITKRTSRRPTGNQDRLSSSTALI